MKTLTTLVISVALIVGLVGCAPAPTQYNLTISSTEGGSVTTPGQGTGSFTYDEDEVIDLVAEPEDGYHFVNWTGDVGTIANVNAATTTITMNDDYSITANFELEQEQAPTEVRLGTCLPETGVYYGFGQELFGMQKAVDDINAQGGIYLSKWNKKVPVRLFHKDNKSDLTQVETLTTDLVVTDKVHALLSSDAFAPLHDPMSVVANEYGVPQIICGGPLEPWYYGTRAGTTDKWPYTWFAGFAIAAKSAPPRDVPGYTLVDACFAYMDRVNAKANTNMIAGVFGSNDSDGVGWYNEFPGLMEDYGMTVVGVNESLGLFPMDATDFTSIIQAWKAAGVEIIWGNCPGPLFGELLSQCYEEGFRPKICLVHRAALLPVDVISWGTEPPLGWGVGTEVWWSPHYAAADGFVGIGGRTAASLAEDWAAEVGEPLNQFIGPGYMGAQVMLDTIERAGNVDADAINAALATTDLHTINGWVKFDPVTHFSPQPISFGQWFYDANNKDEPFTLYIVVSALDFTPAEADPIFPKPW
jgi:branched-chain amino acid transport system substrate-binding protein